MKDRTVDYYLKVASETVESVKQKELAWSAKKKELLAQIKVQATEIESQLGRVERGINACGDIEHHLEQMKDLFEEVEDGDQDIKDLRNEIEE